jgi:ribA/ribD-fused uncharacterized protein
MKTSENKEAIRGFKSERYKFLSNFYPVPIFYNGYTYPSAEHAYQAAKTDLAWEKQMIRDAETPGQAKKLGKRVSHRPGFDKLQTMEEILRRKFSDNSDLAYKLMDTGEQELIESNWWHDNYWGSCTCERCKRIKKDNHLGKTLMRIRKEIQERAKW